MDIVEKVTSQVAVVENLKKLAMPSRSLSEQTANNVSVSIDSCSRSSAMKYDVCKKALSIS